MEYNDLMKQAEEHNKKLHRTKDINIADILTWEDSCLLYTSPSPRDRQKSRMPSSA